MAESTSIVHLIADVDQALSALESVESKLEKLESSDNKLDFGMDKSTVKDLNKTFSSLGKEVSKFSQSAGEDFNKAFNTKDVSDLQQQIAAFGKESLKLDDVNIDTGSVMSQLDSIAGQIQIDLTNMLQSAFTSGVTMPTNLTSNFAKVFGLQTTDLNKTASDAEESSGRVEKAVAKINDSWKNLSTESSMAKVNAEVDKLNEKYGKLADTTSDYANASEKMGKQSQEAAKVLKASNEAAEDLNKIYGDLNEAQDKNGKITLDSLHDAGYKDSDIEKLSKQIETDQKVVQNSGKILKAIDEDYSTIQKINDTLGNGNQYKADVSGLDKTLSQYSKIDTKELETARSDLDGLKGTLTDLQNCYHDGSLDLNELFGLQGWEGDQGIQRLLSFPDELKRVQKETKAVTSDLGNLGINDKLANNISNYQTKINGLNESIAKLGEGEAKSNLTATAQDIQTAYDKLRVDASNATSEEEWVKVGKAFEGIQQSVSDANVEVEKFESSSSGMGSFFTDLSGSLTNAFSTIKNVIGTQMIYREIRQVAKEMVSTVNEIDTAMTQLQIVTGASSTQMTDFFEGSISQAKELGQSVTDVLDEIQVYSRLGYDLEDASQLAEYTSILSNVAAVDVEDATTGLTSVIKGFNLDVSEAEHVSDVLVDIGQNYAVSASEILEAFQNSSAAFGATGTTFEEAAAIIAAGNAAVQDASTVGTALKTVSARIRRSTTELDELGESYDDLAGGFSKYRDELMALTGFDIMEEGSTDDFKSIYDIFDGIAQTWDTLTETQQSRVSEILGGTRQLQVISSIINNWDDAAEAYADAMDSAGVATQAQATWMESLQAKTDQFHASVQELYYDFLSSDLAKGVVDFGTEAIQVFDGMVDSIGSISSAIVALGAGSAIKGLA